MTQKTQEERLTNRLDKAEEKISGLKDKTDE
jgi:hypothetical protein